MDYSKHIEIDDFTLTKNNKKKNNFSEKKPKTNNKIYSTKHIRKTVTNLNKKYAKK